MNALVPPPGFIAMPPTPGNAFLIHTAQLWIKLEDEYPVFGFRVEPHHNSIHRAAAGVQWPGRRWQGLHLR